MKFTYKAELDFIEVHMVLYGLTEVKVRAVLDTGSNNMVIVPHLIGVLGLKTVQSKSHIMTVGGSFSVPKVRIPKIYALGYELADIDALAFELPEKIGVEVILGLKYFERFTQLSINFKKHFVEIMK